jgi:Protein of unknown function (DUF4232)
MRGFFIRRFGGKLACMKPLALAALTILLLATSACVRLASTPPPEPSPEKEGLCRIADLQASSSSSDAGGSLVIGVTLFNISKSPCTLRGYPQMMLTANGKALNIQTVQARVGQESSVPTLKIAPGESAIAIAVWENYCASAPTGDLGIRLTLATGEGLDLQSDIQSPPGCDASNQPSTLSVNPYSYPP